jgi:hypothetical protein
MKKYKVRKPSDEEFGADVGRLRALSQVSKLMPPDGAYEYNGTVVNKQERLGALSIDLRSSKVGDLFKVKQQGKKVADAIIRVIDDSPAYIDTSGTPAIDVVYTYVFGKYAGAKNWGIVNCRKILDSNSWSQHAWGNGLDIGGDPRLLDTIANDLYEKAKSGALPIAQLLWKGKNMLTGGSVYDHTDHIHISGSPMKTGTPPCAG